MSQLYPGLLAIAAIAGLRLAWAWYHRLALRPLGLPPAPFRAFGFSDQLIWGWVAALALTLLARCPTPWRLLGANLLLVLGVLYAARGLAVVRGAVEGRRRAGRCGAGRDRHVSAAVRRRRAHAARARRHLARFPASDVDAGHRRVRSMIEVILREDVKSLGKAGEMVRVKPGYARNFLLPQGLAFEATEGNKKRIAAETRARGARNQAERAEAERVCRRARCG